MEKIVILGTAHRLREPGKQSPDGRLKECIYSREIVESLRHKLNNAGVRTFVDFSPLDLEKTMQTPSVKLERQRELGLRVNEVNEIAANFGKKNCIYVSIHCDASGSDGKWHDPNGWSVRVSPNASAESRALADKLFKAAHDYNLRVRRPSPTQNYWEQSLYVLNRTICPAVLTENLFQDNLADVDFLLSDLGRHSIERLHFEGIMRYLDFMNEMEIIDNI